MHTLDSTVLHRWSSLLKGLCLFALGYYGIEIVGFWVFNDITVTLSQGQEVWSFQVSALPFAVQMQLFVGYSIPLLLWAWCALLLWQVARKVRQHHVFVPSNALAIKRAGLVILLAGITSSLGDILLPFLLYQQNFVPWMADLDLDDLVMVETLFGGAFFFCIGKILESAVVLSERDRLTI